MKKVLAVSALMMLAACSPPASQNVESAAPSVAAAATLKVDAPSGEYKLDKMHASLVFRVSHMGFSNYTARFSKFDATLRLDTANPSATTLEASVDPASLGLENPPPGFVDELRGPNWLDVKQFPTITFKSTNVELTGPDTARVTGDLTLHGVTKPVVLDAKFNGGYPGMIYDPNARVGFSATGVFKRSDFGISVGILQPGSYAGVGDDVHVVIETEFNGPKWVAPSTAPSVAP